MRPFRLGPALAAAQIEGHCLRDRPGLERVGRAVLSEPGPVGPGGGVFADSAFLNGEGDLTAAVGAARGVAHGLQGRGGVACVGPVVLGREGYGHEWRAATRAVLAGVEPAEAEEAFYANLNTLDMVA